MQPTSDGLQTRAEQDAPTADLTKLNIEIVEYSEKAIAVFGDTKPIKETLKTSTACSVPISPTKAKGV